jgi:hypothetical protein
MAKLWQLKNIVTNEPLTELAPLPENWNGIFGMSGFKDKIHELSWCGFPDQGWVEVDVPDSVIDTEKNKKVVDNQIEHYLNESLEYVALDNTSISKAERAEWFEYRRLLKDIPNQPHYPNEIVWPKKPN